MDDMRNIAVGLSYDGSRYHGWQVQKDQRTIAGTIESALERLFGTSTKISGCGRTDAGVHAEQYCFNFKTTSNIPIDRLPLAINRLLPPDISAHKAVYVHNEFDANLSCIKKEYSYRIYSSRIRNPFYANRVHFYPNELRLDDMREAASYFVGTHDFSAMRSVGTVTKTAIRTVYWYDIEKNDHIAELRVCASGFLYNMARAMAGTLIYVSEGKIAPDDIPRLLEEKDRRQAGPTAPPQGLYLSRLWYDGDAGEMFT